MIGINGIYSLDHRAERNDVHMVSVYDLWIFYLLILELLETLDAMLSMYVSRRVNI